MTDLHKAALAALEVMLKFKEHAPLTWRYDKEYDELCAALIKQHINSDNC
jgi:hypothetical protein